MHKAEIIISFIYRKTGQQGTECTESFPTNKQNILDLQKRIVRFLVIRISHE